MSPACFLPRRFMAVWYYYYRRYYYFFLFFFGPLTAFLKYYDGGRVVKHIILLLHTYVVVDVGTRGNWNRRRAWFIPIIPFLWLRLFSNITACLRTEFLQVSVSFPPPLPLYFYCLQPRLKLKWS